MITVRHSVYSGFAYKQDSQQMNVNTDVLACRRRYLLDRDVSPHVTKRPRTTGFPCETVYVYSKSLGYSSVGYTQPLGLQVAV